MGGRWDTYRVRKGTSLTRSRKTPNAFRGLIHGKKGVRTHAEFFKVEKTFSGTLIANSAKGLLLVGGIYVMFAAVSVLVSAVVDGVKAGLAEVSQAVSAVSSYLVIAAAVAAAIAFVFYGIKIARSIHRARTRSIERSEARQRAATAARASADARAAQPSLIQQATGTPQVARAYATAVAGSPATPAGWYLDPSNSAQFRYWNGSAWTQYVGPSRIASAPPANWYPDPTNTSRLRYWNGTTWTAHFAPRNSASPEPTGSKRHVPEASPLAGSGTRITMTRSEWQDTVRGWMIAGAVEQELWRRLSNAQIVDADPLTAEAQRRMEQLSAEQASEKLRLLLEAKPALRDDARVAAFLTDFVQNVSLLDRSQPAGVAPSSARRLLGDPTGPV